MPESTRSSSLGLRVPVGSREGLPKPSTPSRDGSAGSTRPELSHRALRCALEASVAGLVYKCSSLECSSNPCARHTTSRPAAPHAHIRGKIRVPGARPYPADSPVRGSRSSPGRPTQESGVVTTKDKPGRGEHRSAHGRINRIQRLERCSPSGAGEGCGHSAIGAGQPARDR